MINIFYIVVVIAVVFISMTLHEAMHAFSSFWLGDDTAKLHGRLSFNPIKHVDLFLTILLPLSLALVGAPIFGGAKPVPYNPNRLRFGEWGAMIVALAGPLTNLFIAFISFGLLVVFNNNGVNSEYLNLVLNAMISVNLGFFVFNMLPIPPLDGSRVLRALAPDFIQTIMDSLESVGIFIIFGIILLVGPTFNSFIYFLIRWFIDLFAMIFGV